MKLFPTIIFSLSAVLLVISIHQVMVNGFADSYWLLSFSMIFFLWFAYLKRNEKPGEEVAKKYDEITGKSKKTRKK